MASKESIKEGQALKGEWKIQWNNSPRKSKIEAIDNSFPFDSHRKISNTLTRAQASLLIQLRTRHIPLNSYLHKIGKTASNRCEACWRQSQVMTPESVQHFLFECPEYAIQRSRLENKLGRDSRDLRSILKNKDKTLELVHYIAQTKRLRFSLGELKEQGD